MTPVLAMVNKMKGGKFFLAIAVVALFLGQLFIHHDDFRVNLYSGGSKVFGLLFLMIGWFFISSYVFYRRCQFFLFVVRVCEIVSWPPSKKMAIFYGVLFIFAGLGQLLFSGSHSFEIW
jgi:hypothetical protein